MWVTVFMKLDDYWSHNTMDNNLDHSVNRIFRQKDGSTDEQNIWNCEQFQFGVIWWHKWQNCCIFCTANQPPAKKKGGGGLNGYVQ